MNDASYYRSIRHNVKKKAYPHLFVSFPRSRVFRNWELRSIAVKPRDSLFMTQVLSFHVPPFLPRSEGGYPADSPALLTCS